jgi:hypothetical protein
MRDRNGSRMKKPAIKFCSAICSMLLMSGCLGLHFGGGTKTTMQDRSQTYNVSLGQQLIDLQKAYDAGIITEAEYKAEKKKMLRHYGTR